MQKQSELVNEFLHFLLVLWEWCEEEVRTLPEPRTKASRSPPKPVHPNPVPSRCSGMQTPQGAGRLCQHPAAELDLGHGPRHNKRLLSQETAVQEKTRAGRM